MSELERRLVALGAEVAFPQEPELAAGMRARLEAGGQRPRTSRRPLLVAIAVTMVLALAVALAVPQARTAILRFFHLRGATVERVEVLPRVRERVRARDLGRPVELREAERMVGFRILLPSFRGEQPERIYVLDGVLASLNFRKGGTALLLSEFRANDLGLLKKVVAAGTTVEPVTVDGGPGLWIAGGVHTLGYVDRLRRLREREIAIRGSVLLWERGDLTLRLEGATTKGSALQLARTIR